MSLIEIRSTVPARRSFLVALFSAFLAIAFVHQPGVAVAEPVKQIKLTEKQVQNYIAAYKDMAALGEKADPNKPDPKIQAQMESAAKKYGFASLDEYDDVAGNISLVMSGIDPQTKKFTEPPEAIKREIEEIKADKKMSPADKKKELDELNESLKDARPVQFKENIALVTKYFDKLAALNQA